MKRSFFYLSYTFGIVLIVSGVLVGLYKADKVNAEEREKKEITITDNYEIFKEYIDTFNDKRVNVSKKVSNDLTKENAKENYEEWIKELDEYTEVLKKVDNSSTLLKKECIGYESRNMDIANKCKSFIIAYETVMNYYAKDIDAFNKFINEYNSIEDEKLELYETNYSYTDIDYDGNFYGKN